MYIFETEALVKWVRYLLDAYILCLNFYHGILFQDYISTFINFNIYIYIYIYKMFGRTKNVFKNPFSQILY